jgi:ATP/maltotriose-dependent transcriptional regulator MalT/DNA-binding SARP family transcriptional activator
VRLESSTTAATSGASARAAARHVPTAKLRPPALPTSYVPRPSLLARLDDALERRLTAVVAGPGFGKSTVVAAWAEAHDAAWYTVDSADVSLGVFARGLVASLKLRVPDLSDEIELAGSSVAGADEQAQAHPVAALLCKALEERLTHDLALVLDDVQELGERTGPARLLEALCRQAPPTLHLVLASRADAPFPVERLRGRGQLLRLDASMLSFTVDEIEFLVAASLGTRRPEFAAELHGLTSGWPAAVTLALDALRDATDDEYQRVIERLRRPGGPLFAYLAEEAFAREPRGVRDLLRCVAPFDRFTVGLCEAVGVERPEETLARLTGRGLFVQEEAGHDGWFRVHALVRDFAATTWPLSPDELRDLHLRAAEWFELSGEVDAALRSATAAADPVALGRLLAEHGAQLLLAGSIEQVLTAAAHLPVEGRSERVEEIIGEAHGLKGRWEDALGCYERAAKGAETLPPALAWKIGRIHFDRGRPEEALSMYSRGRIDGSDPADEALLLAGMASASLSRGQLESSRRTVVDALERATESGDPRALAAAHNVAMVIALRTDPSDAGPHYRAGLEAAEQAGDIVQVIRIRSNHVAQLIQEGSYEEALAEIEPAVHLGEVAGIPLALAFALLKRGETHLCLGQHEQALANFDTARSLYERVGSNRAFGALMETAEIYRERGDHALARTALEAALRGAKQADDVQVTAYASANLARVVATEEPERARALAEEAVELGHASSHALVFALLSSGWVALVQGDRDHAAARALESAAAARERGDRSGLAEALELEALSAAEPKRGRSLLEDAAAIWRELRNRLAEAKVELALARLAGDGRSAAQASRRLRALGVRVGAQPAAGLLGALPPEDPAPLTVQALGGFRVLRDGVPVPATEWQSKKARDLLKLLVARRGRPATRELLMEALWPEEDPKKTANRLSVALSTLRGVLDPAHTRPADHYVRSSKDAVALESGRVVLDTEGFLGEAEAGLAAQREGRNADALELLEAAESSYSGDFLEEDVYEDWATPMREELRAAYIAVLRGLTTTTTDPVSASRYLLRLLERDPYDEGAHLALVSALSAARSHGEARRAYRSYVARMEEIDVEPALFPASMNPALSPP